MSFFVHILEHISAFMELFKKCFIKDSPRRKIRATYLVKCHMWVWNLLPPGRVTSSQAAVRINGSTSRGPQWTTGHKPRGGATNITAFSKLTISTLIPHPSIPFRTLPSQVAPRLWNPCITHCCEPPRSAESLLAPSLHHSKPSLGHWNFSRCLDPVCPNEPLVTLSLPCAV